MSGHGSIGTLVIPGRPTLMVRAPLGRLADACSGLGWLGGGWRAQWEWVRAAGLNAAAHAAAEPRRSP
jgi:hypothetical protein